MTLAARRVVIGRTVLTVAKDSFTDVSSTNLTAHTMDIGSGWAVTATNTYNISGTGTAFISVAAGRSTATTTTTAADATVSATGVIAGTNDYGLTVRWTDDNNHFVVSYNGSTFRVIAGAFVSMGTFTACAAGDVLAVAMSGSSFSVLKNGASVLTFSDSFNQTAVKHGLRSNGATVGQWDNFLVTAP